MERRENQASSQRVYVECPNLTFFISFSVLFNLIRHETGFKADIYISRKDELHHWAFLKKREIEISGETIWLAPPEYVLLRKLEYYREGGSDKHIRDIAGIMEVSGHQIAFNELEEKIMRLGLEKEWEKAKDFESK